eukprot:956153-Pleurochrysis_carterae.AAC.1
MQPLLKAWFKRSATDRTALVVDEFKVLVLTETVDLELPPNCACPDAKVARSKSVAVRAVKKMLDKNYPLSCGLLALAGKERDSWEMAAAEPLEAKEQQRRNQPATQKGGSMQAKISPAKGPAKRRRGKRAAAEVEDDPEEWASANNEKDKESLPSPSLSLGSAGRPHLMQCASKWSEAGVSLSKISRAVFCVEHLFANAESHWLPHSPLQMLRSGN